MGKIMVSIVVLNYETYTITIKNVNNLILKTDTNIVIVDNKSSNGSFEELKKYYKGNERVLVVSTEYNGGYAYGNNYGIKRALYTFKDTKYIGIMNPDVFIISEDTINKLIWVLENENEIAWVAPTMIQNNGLDQESFGWKAYTKKDVIFSNEYFLGKFVHKNHDGEVKSTKEYNIKYTDIVKGCFFVIKKDAFQKIGFFDERTFLYYEEDIVGSKLKKLGYSAACLLDEFFIHEHNHKEETLLTMIKHVQLTTKSKYYYFKECLNPSFIERFLCITLRCLYVYFEVPVTQIIKRIIKNCLNNSNNK